MYLSFNLKEGGGGAKRYFLTFCFDKVTKQKSIVAATRNKVKLKVSYLGLKFHKE